jgi:hypothetical protein
LEAGLEGFSIASLEGLLVVFGRFVVVWRETKERQAKKGFYRRLLWTEKRIRLGSSK